MLQQGGVFGKATYTFLIVPEMRGGGGHLRSVQLNVEMAVSSLFRHGHFDEAKALGLACQAIRQHPWMFCSNPRVFSPDAILFGSGLTVWTQGAR